MLKIKEMKPEDKDLLLKDLCERLPYRVMVHHPDYDEPECLDTVFTPDAWNEGGIMCTIDDHWDSPHDIRYCKPYLRPMSSMTEEEILDFLQIPDLSLVSKRFINDIKSGNFGIMVNMSNYARNIDWLNKNMFDYRGLIEKGLAIEVTENNNPYKD